MKWYSLDSIGRTGFKVINNYLLASRRTFEDALKKISKVQAGIKCPTSKSTQSTYISGSIITANYLLAFAVLVYFCFLWPCNAASNHSLTEQEKKDY